MALKGHTKIQLFDAKTNKLVQEVEEDNMVTDAISKTLNVPYEYMLNDVTPYIYLNNVLPIQTVGMAGVLLFKDKIPESTTNIIPSMEYTAVGHAGGEYSGTNAFRGTYNTSESKALSNGYRNVWDFATDKANGDISCVCLTSLTGGNIGVDENSDSQTAIQSLGNVTSSISSSLGRFVGVIGEGDYCIANIASNKLTLTYRRGFTPSKIILKESATNPFLSPYKTVEIPLTGFSNVSDYNGKMYVDDEGVLKGWNSDYSSIGNYNYDFFIYYYKANILTGEKIANKTVTVNFSSFPSGRYVVGTTGYNAYYNFHAVSLLKNYVVCMTTLSNPSNSSYPWVTVLLDYDGNYVKEITDGTWSNGSINRNLYDFYNKAISISSFGTGTRYHWITEDGSPRHWVGAEEKSYVRAPFVYSYKNIYPYCILNYTVNDIVRLHMYKNQIYLATINNLATTVTKTSEQTMKITYDITET